MSFVNKSALQSEIHAAVVNQKANACPMILRLAWHAAGTYDKKDNSGGSTGAGMRFEPEASDPANAGLSIVRDMLLPVKARHPEISYADLWALAGASAIEFLGGPKVDVKLGRGDFANGGMCPANGRLPDASQGAEHLRQVFGRMGFNDQEIVALSGAHTLGRCHVTRSGFDGPWTRNPLKFDNAYFKTLLGFEWTPKKWDGPLQYEDETGELMMLPTDLCLKTDPAFRKWCEVYAKDEQRFFKDFAAAFSKLIHNGVVPEKSPSLSESEKASEDFREYAMHGSLSAMKKVVTKANVHDVEKSSNRTALHKAAFWGHEGIIEYLCGELKLNVNALDSNGDTPLHDAARFGHFAVCKKLLASGADPSIRNNDGKDVLDICSQYNKKDIAVLCRRPKF